MRACVRVCLTPLFFNMLHSILNKKKKRLASLEDVTIAAWREAPVELVPLNFSSLQSPRHQNITATHQQTRTALSSGRLRHILTGGRRNLQRGFEERFRNEEATSLQIKISDALSWL